MYDKVRLYIDATTAPNYCAVADTIVNHLDSPTTIENQATNETITTGRLGALTVTRYQHNVLISGSLPKYLYGNNIARLDRRATAAAIEKMCDELGADITTAKVTGLEFGAVFTLAHPVREYYARFGTPPGMLRYIEVQDETIYYRTKGKEFAKQLAFYDKTKESAATGVNTPPRLANLLRYELRINKRLPQILQTRDITARKLYGNNLYTTIMSKYKESYFAIPKQRTKLLAAPDNILTPRDALNVFIAGWIADKDKEFAQFVEALKEANQLNGKVEYYRLRKMFESIQKLYTPALVDEDIIQELDDEITNLDNTL